MSDKTPEERVAAIKERRAKRDESTATARAEQEATDFEAIEALEAEHGYTLNVDHRVAQYVPGCPVIVGIRAPSDLEYKRFFSKINRANGHGDAKVAAQIELAQTCWVYPQDPEQRKAMLAANAALLASVGNVANKLAELEKAEEGKD